MKSKNKRAVGIIFGGRSVEHDVSIVSAQIVMEGLRESGKYEIVPIYITQDGRWISDDSLGRIETFQKGTLKLIENRASVAVAPQQEGKVSLVEKSGIFSKKSRPLDVAFPVMHGTYGEDGTLQGMLEMLGIPYVGCSHTASALAMDKVVANELFLAAGLPKVKYLWFTSSVWEKNPQAVYATVEKELSYPVFVKPANLGSSIGITKAKDRKTLEQGFEVAFRLDSKVIAEQGIDPVTEIFCCLLGNEDPIPSLLEQPVSAEEFLTFSEKYLAKGGTMAGAKSKVKIPAPISAEKTKEIQNMAVKVFQTLGCSGIARVDFLLDPKTDKVYVNEVNPLPGSLQQHLWKASGVALPELVDRLIALALEKFAQKEKLLHTFASPLLSQAGGLKRLKH